MCSDQTRASEASASDFERAIASADIRLFDAIPAELTENDRRSLLHCQNALRSLIPEYVYLEIGSHLGGSIQPHLLDSRCDQIISIDPRPLVQRDERGVRWAYPGNSTSAMLARLQSLAPNRPAIRTIELPTPDVDPRDVGAAPHLSFIDGEHTDKAAYADYLFCERACQSNGIIIFHDAAIVYNALASIVDRLKVAHAVFRAYQLPDTLFVVELGSLTLLNDPGVIALALNNHVGYLTSLRLNDGYRRFANLWPFRMLRHGAHQIGLHRWAERHGYGRPASDGT